MRADLIPSIIEGETILAFAYAEPQGRYNLADLATTAQKDGGSYIVNGHKAVVIGAPMADKLIVTTRTSGQQRDRDGNSRSCSTAWWTCSSPTNRRSR